MSGAKEEPEWWDDIQEADRGDLMVDNDTRREYMKIERSEWDEPRGAWFDVKDPSWNFKKETLSECIDAAADGSGELDLGKYYREMLDYIIVDSSADIGNSVGTFLRGMNNETGDKLEGLVPRPSARGLSEGDEGKSEERSEQDTEEASSSSGEQQ